MLILFKSKTILPSLHLTKLHLLSLCLKDAVKLITIRFLSLPKNLNNIYMLQFPTQNKKYVRCYFSTKYLLAVVNTTVIEDPKFYLLSTLILYMAHIGTGNKLPILLITIQFSAR
jgi:hypothetical protein